MRKKEEIQGMSRRTKALLDRVVLKGEDLFKSKERLARVWGIYAALEWALGNKNINLDTILLLEEDEETFQKHLETLKRKVIRK